MGLVLNLTIERNSNISLRQNSESYGGNVNGVYHTPLFTRTGNLFILSLRRLFNNELPVIMRRLLALLARSLLSNITNYLTSYYNMMLYCMFDRLDRLL